MQRKTLRAAAIGAALLAAMAATALADSKDYEFQLVDKEVKQGEATIAVKLVHKPSGRAIPDAVIFAKRIDMGPDGMATMIRPLEAVASTEPGVYRFKTELDDGGQLGLVARRQGAGRDRHGREQAHRQGDPMSPLLKGMVTVAAVVAAAGAGLWAGQTGLVKLPTRRHDGDDRRGAARRQGSGHLLPRPRREAALLADAEDQRQGTALCGRVRRTKMSGFDPPKPAVAAAGVDAQSRAEDHPLPQPHGASRHLAGAEEGLHGDGLHPGLRG